MGYSNAMSVMQCWGRLDLAPRLLLVHMALTALDPPGRPELPPCLYWAGWEVQASAMHYPISENSRRRLRRLRQLLLDAGAIEIETKARRGHLTRWLVQPMPVDNSPAPDLPWLRGGHGDPPLGGSW